MKLKSLIPHWTMIMPAAAWLLYLLKSSETSQLYAFLLAFGLIGVVMSAVHHAEVVAHKVGEPFGTLVLAVAITIIEVSLIVSLMLAGGPETSTLARDTVFAAIMIILTGIIGVCLLVGGYKYKEQAFGEFGVNAALVTLTAISILTLVLPNFTTSIAGPVYSLSQLIFIAAVSLIIYGAFVFIQTGRHRDYFLPEGDNGSAESHAEPPTLFATLLSLALLLVCLVAVVLIAKTLAPTIEKGVVEFGAPKSIVGIIVAFVILLPEGIAAYKAARKNRLQTSLNLALGSALASIGLTIPAVAIVSATTDLGVTLGIDMKSIVLLMLSLLTIIISFGSGKTNVLQGIVLLVIFAVYLFTSIVP
ncbi:MAG: ionic transporter y4hA [Ferruginibacter sp.]|nr:ionic transporter y4hA [Ferruginibacter sp.]